jgi:UDP-galactopyranose mutase
MDRHKIYMTKTYLIVGAGFSGAVLARELAERTQHKILVIDTRDHVAGNCHTERDSATGVMVHRYGPHIFHTSNQRVWDYVRSYAEFRPFVNRVKASIDRGVFSLPINLHTINQFFGKRLNPVQAKAFLATQGDASISDPQNFEEQALRFIGPDLYHAFFHGYTKKQWGCNPTELPASILQRLPVRFSYDDNYYNSRFQGMPADGYTALIANILDHEQIEVKLGVAYETAMMDEFEHVFFTGPIDAFYDFRFGRLGYRTVFWDRMEGSGDIQGNAVINYPQMDVNYTRIHEHKHFTPWEEHEKSVAFVEFSKETTAEDIPYYPKRLSGDKERLDRYLELGRQESKVSFLGRLGTYRYLDMHQIIAEALAFSETFLSKGAASSEVRFSGGDTNR